MLTSEGYVTTDDGVRLFVQRLGSGPDVVIVPNAVHMIDSFRHLGASRTAIFFDLRNRGRSDAVNEHSKLCRGIYHDVEDVERVRRHFGVGQVSLIGHSYVGLTAILYAMRYGAHVSRIVQIGPPPPRAGTQYPTHLTGADEALTEFIGKFAQLLKEREATGSREFCRKFWELMRVLYVVDPADAAKIHWTPCESANDYWPHWTGNILPSIQALDFAPDALSKVTIPVLIVHGRRDRQSPYGGGREWASRLPNARLVTVEHAAHVPWIEAGTRVFGAIERFLDGAWPEEAETVEAVADLAEGGRV